MNLRSNGRLALDIMEEFEFKPITEGLGFHKKQVSLKEETKKAQDHVVKNTKVVLESEDLQKVRQPVQPESIKDLISSFPAMDGLDFVEEEARSQKSQAIIKEALPRKDLSADQVMKVNDPELKVNPEVFQRKISVVDMKPLISEAPQKAERLSEKKLVTEYIKRGPSIATYLIDALTIVGITNVFLAVLLVVTKVDVIYVLTHSDTSLVTKASVGLLLYAIWMFYLLVSRTFFSKTLGEWAMDYQLGNPDETTKMAYPFKIVARAFVNTLSGIILVPLFSVLFKKDLLGKFCGLSLYKKVESWR